ncbi:MAG: hypothetical protein AAB432_00900 [Patescibacteria group bacterium]
MKKSGLIKVGTILGLVFLSAILFFIFEKSWQDLFFDESKPTAHFYRDSSVPISDINLKVFYVVPANRTANILSNWREVIENNLAKVSAFHVLQFRGLSRLTYDIYPEIVILKNNEDIYNSKANGGTVIISIAEELSRRVFTPSGDLYNADSVPSGENKYAVLGLVYEGENFTVFNGGIVKPASAKESVHDFSLLSGVPESIIFKADLEKIKGFFLIGRDNLINSPTAIGSTQLYEIIAHTFGLPDAINSVGVPLSDDLMGLGRVKPIENNYLSRKTLKDLGVLSDL